MLQGEVFHLVHGGSLCNFCLVFMKLLSFSSGHLDEICSLPLVLVILNDSLLIVSPMQNQKCSKFVQSQFGYWGIRQQRETSGKPVLPSATPPPVSSTACSTGKPGSSLISSFSGHTKKKSRAISCSLTFKIFPWLVNNSLTARQSSALDCLSEVRVD